MPSPVDKLTEARCRLATLAPFYGHACMQFQWIASNMDWMPANRVKTIGVRISAMRGVECIYYPPFVESLTVPELYAIIQHEVEHIVRCHCTRRGSREPEVFNIAADMVVNGPRNKPRIGYNLNQNKDQTQIPMAESIVWIPPDWGENESTDDYYNRLIKNCRIIKVQQPADGQEGQGGQGDEDDQDGKGKKQQPQNGKNEGGGDGKPKPGQGNKYQVTWDGKTYQTWDDHSIWDQGDASDDEARQIVKDIVDNAIEKSRGDVPGHLTEAIAALNKPIVKWRQLLQQYIGRHIGNRRKTISRRNRRNDAFGIPGYSKHAASTVNVIIDTSGSVSQEELKQFFSEIDTIAYRSKVKVLQWDHSFQGYAAYKKGAWKKFKVHGRGGTDMAAPIHWLVKNGQIADVQILLTDGECNYAEPMPINMITVVTRPGTGMPTWGLSVVMDMTR